MKSLEIWIQICFLNIRYFFAVLAHKLLSEMQVMFIVGIILNFS